MNAVDTDYRVISEYYKEHSEEICVFVCGRIGREDIAKDIMQTVFERLLCTDRMITAVTLPGLAYTIARNLICDYWRHRRAVEEYEHYILRFDPVDGRKVESTESVYSAKEIGEILDKGIERLTLKQREVYVMSIYGGMKVSEISDTLKINYKSVENRLGAARKQIRLYVRSRMAI